MNIFVLFKEFLINFMYLIWTRVFLFFISSYQFVRNVRLQRPNGQIRNTLPTILEHIDIFHDRFLTGKWRLKWRNEAHRICKEERIIQKNHQKEVSYKSSQVKIYINSCRFAFVLCIFKIKCAFLATTQGKI